MKFCVLAHFRVARTIFKLQINLLFVKIPRWTFFLLYILNFFLQLEEEPFNPDFVEVDRVLDVAEHKEEGEDKVVKHYLVKWRSMSYEEATWELEEDIDPVKIEEFERFRKLPPRDQWKVMNNF